MIITGMVAIWSDINLKLKGHYLVGHLGIQYHRQHFHGELDSTGGPSGFPGIPHLSIGDSSSIMILKISISFGPLPFLYPRLTQFGQLQSRKSAESYRRWIAANTLVSIQTDIR
jgi:hypothetical protein